MLHLNRKQGEVIHLTHKGSGETIDLVVLEVRGKTVKLGFEDAAKSHTVLRKEVRQAQEGFSNPNPYYRDEKPVINQHKPYGITKVPLIDMKTAVDDLQQIVDELIPTTEETPAEVAT
jgi:sRNA-binding carbon storage regulator CsrA